jgi:hypothetical protein
VTGATLRAKGVSRVLRETHEHPLDYQASVEVGPWANAAPVAQAIGSAV